MARLYAGFLLPDKPINRNHFKKSERNAEIIARHAAGEGLSDLARYYGLSPQRVSQIVRGQRK